MDELDLRDGYVSDDLAEEFPDLRLDYVALEGGSGRSTEEVRRRLGELSNRMTGAQVVHMRQDPVPWAYRVFFRQVGVDPDSDRTPVEQIALDRMKWGGLRSRNLLDDALTIATVETGVPVIAFDADRVSEPLGLRLAREGECLGGEGGRALSARQLVVADPAAAVAVLFGDVSDRHGVTPTTTRMLLAAPSVKGVPRISVEEALWTASDLVVGG